MIVVEGEQRTPEWFKLRAGVITGTGFAVIQYADARIRQDGIKYGSKTKHKYMCKKAIERLNGEYIEDNSFLSWQMRQGIEREPEALALYSFISGYEVTQPAFIFRDESRKAGVSPDGLVVKSHGIEIKSPDYHTHIDYLTGNQDPVMQYRAQIQGALWVTKMDRWDMVSYCPHMPNVKQQIAIWQVGRDEAYIAKLSVAVQEVEKKLAVALDQLKTPAANRVWKSQLKEAA